jgi:hypothetical protein
MGKKLDLLGQRFGMLTVIGKGGLSPSGDRKWICRCDCGVERENKGSALTKGQYQSCGCARRKLRNDLTGKRFGKLTVIKHLGRLTKSTNQYYECLCDCGNTSNVSAPNLTAGSTRSCGCLFKRDLTGQVFGKLTVIRPGEPNKFDNNPMWHCLCECGSEKNVRQASLEMGHTRSCGCLCLETRFRKHGMTGTKVYKTWRGIQDRCYNEKIEHYPSYGGRGIRVCDRWLESFDDFYADMGDPPTPEHSIERRDVDGDYEPSNCMWATLAEQANNRQNTVRIEYKGQLYSIRDVYNSYDGYIHPSVDIDTFRWRASRGWEIEKAMSKPYKKQVHKRSSE